MTFAETTQTITHNGETVFFSVSPCSWMHRGYGLQIKLCLREGACNAESEFVIDKTIEATDRPLAELDAAGKVLAEAWLAEHGTTVLHKNVAAWQVVSAQFQEDMAKHEKREAAAEKRMDAKRLAQGYTHRVNAWIHPANGDDYQSVSYVAGEPDQKVIAKILRGSTVKNDYTVTVLGAKA